VFFEALPEMNLLLRLLVVAMVLIAGVLGLAACADGLCSEFVHVCCSSVVRSRPLKRLARRLAAVSSSAASFALMVFAIASRVSQVMLASFVPVPALLRASSLRI